MRKSDGFYERAKKQKRIIQAISLAKKVSRIYRQQTEAVSLGLDIPEGSLMGNRQQKFWIFANLKM